MFEPEVDGRHTVTQINMKIGATRVDFARSRFNY